MDEITTGRKVLRQNDCPFSPVWKYSRGMVDKDQNLIQISNTSLEIRRMFPFECFLLLYWVQEIMIITDIMRIGSSSRKEKILLFFLIFVVPLSM